MATMCPDVPVSAAPESAEARLYLALRDLPDDYRIYHSVSYYLSPKAGEPLREGEIDFLILHPELGLLVLEVKGGEISYDGRTKVWTSVNRQGRAYEIQDPFRQAQHGEKSLIREIERRGFFNGSGPTFAHGHAVVFPDCRYDPERIPIAAPRELVIDADDLERGAQAAVDRVFRTIQHGRTVQPMTKKLVKQLGQQVLAPHFQLVSTLRQDLGVEKAAFVRLEDEQLACLDSIEANPRVLVEGAAGTGKTVVACEAARRLATDGASVLLLCYNRPLGAQLSRFAEGCAGLPGRMWAGSFHELCRAWAGRAGLEWREPVGPGAAGASEFWNDESGMLLLEAAGKLTDRFDALVIDEAQDFLPDWFEILKSLLHDPACARIALFRDPNQDLWDRCPQPPWDAARLPLRTNLRNTRAIGEYVAKFAGVEYRFPWSTPAGVEPEIIPYADAADEREKVAGKIGWLQTQGITPDNIALIGTRRIENSFLRDDRIIADLPVEAVDDRGFVSRPGILRYATPHRFKGLEADVVLMCDVDGDGRACSKRNLYVAASRAKHRLYVFELAGKKPAESSLPGSAR